MTKNTCWINENDKIISFHPINNYILRRFETHLEYLEYVIHRINRGYKVI